MADVEMYRREVLGMTPSELMMWFLIVVNMAIVSVFLVWLSNVIIYAPVLG